MRELLNQDRALAPATIRLATRVLGILFALTAIIIIINSGLNILSGAVGTGLLQITGGLGLLLAFFLIVRLQAEAVIAAHRTNDRLMILTDALSPREEAIPSPPAAARARKTTPRKPAATKPKPAAKPATDSPDT